MRWRGSGRPGKPELGVSSPNRSAAYGAFEVERRADGCEGDRTIEFGVVLWDTCVWVRSVRGFG